MASAMASTLEQVAPCGQSGHHWARACGLRNYRDHLVARSSRSGHLRDPALGAP